MHNLKLAPFCNTNQEDRSKPLTTRGYFADGLYGDMSGMNVTEVRQVERDKLKFWLLLMLQPEE